MNQPADDSSLDFGPTLRGLREGMKAFGRYTLVRMLGRGGMGVVWLAKDSRLDLDIALKFLPEHLTHDEVAIEDLRRETRRSVKLTHTNIVHVYDLVEDGTTAAIAMEFVDGKSLSGLRLERPAGVFQPEDLAPLLRQVCDALTYAHETAKVVHQDLKPANVMVDRQGVVKVMDFGIASSIGESLSRLSRKAGSSGGGTLPYMSPQQLMGYPPSVSDDVYALGAMIYELLTGRPPFYRGSLETQIQSVTQPRLSERRTELGVTGTGTIPEVWEQTLAACLEKEAEKRPTSVTEVWRRLSDAKVHGAQPDAALDRVEERSQQALGHWKQADNRTNQWSAEAQSADEGGQQAIVVRSTTWRKSLVLGAVVLVLIVSVIGLWFGSKQLRGTKLQWSTKEVEASKPQQADTQSPDENSDATSPSFWAKRMDWLDSHLVRAESADKLKADQFEELRRTAIAGNIQLSQPEVQEPIATEYFREVAFRVTATGDQDNLVKWLVTLQSPEKFRTIKSLELEISGGAKETVPQAKCDFIMALWYSDNAGTVTMTKEVIDNGRLVEGAKLRWDAFRPAIYPEYYPMVRLSWIASAMPPQGIVIERFSVRVDAIDLIVQARDSAAASLFLKELNSNPQTRVFAWTEKSLEDKGSVEKFLVQGKSVGGDGKAKDSASTASGSKPVDAVLTEPSTSGVSIGSASKETPFANTLGMKFVPVPITGGPTDGKKVLFSIWDTRVKDYAAYAAEKSGVNEEWKNPFSGYQQTENEPVVKVSWEDAKTFCEWLTQKERAAGRLPSGWSYRLPSDHEWSCAVGIGQRENSSESPLEKSGKIDDEYPWGREWPPPKNSGNHDSYLKVDDYKYTSPVGFFPPNRYGLYDMGGNVLQWCEDRYQASSCVLRGSACFQSFSQDESYRKTLLSSCRDGAALGCHDFNFGFRCVVAAGGGSP